MTLKYIVKMQALLVVAITFISISSCADVSTSALRCPDSKRVNQAFSFGGYGENQGVEILEVNYGIPGCPPNYDSNRVLFNGKVLQTTNIVSAPFRRAWVIYVKWRIVSTGQHYEKTVELRDRLPTDMTDHRVHFSIENGQLSLYLISPERRPINMPLIGPKPYQSLKTLVIFPD